MDDIALHHRPNLPSRAPADTARGAAALAAEFRTSLHQDRLAAVAQRPVLNSTGGRAGPRLDLIANFPANASLSLAALDLACSAGQLGRRGMVKGAAIKSVLMQDLHPQIEAEGNRIPNGSGETLRLNFIREACSNLNQEQRIGLGFQMDHLGRFNGALSNKINAEIQIGISPRRFVGLCKEIDRSLRVREGTVLGLGSRRETTPDQLLIGRALFGDDL